MGHAADSPLERADDRATSTARGHTSVMDLLRNWQLRRDVTAVVFSCDELELGLFFIEAGPCVLSVEGVTVTALAGPTVTEVSGSTSRHAGRL